MWHLPVSVWNPNEILTNPGFTVCETIVTARNCPNSESEGARGRHTAATPPPKHSSCVGFTMTWEQLLTAVLPGSSFVNSDSPSSPRATIYESSSSCDDSSSALLHLTFAPRSRSAGPFEGIYHTPTLTICRANGDSASGNALPNSRGGVVVNRHSSPHHGMVTHRGMTWCQARWQQVQQVALSPQGRLLSNRYPPPYISANKRLHQETKDAGAGEVAQVVKSGEKTPGSLMFPTQGAPFLP